jgi:tetratricopeptide (TPR) repeat protein
MSIEVKLTFAAITLEMTAIALLLLHSSSVTMLCAYLLLHGIASVCMTPVAWLLMPAHYKEPKFWVMLLLLSLCFFIPVFGVFGFVIAQIITFFLPKSAFRQDFVQVPAPEYQPVRKNKQNEFRLGRTQEQLRNRQLPLDLRMKALLIIQNRPTRYTENLLREALGDPFEDLRLLAYGILASKEKQISQRIHDVLSTLNLAIEQTQTEAAYIATRELAELYWELTYQNLVQGGMRAYALEQVQHYAAQALQWRESDTGLRMLAGRAYLLAGNLEQAESAFKAAISLGLPMVRVFSYLAEIAYLRRDYATVRRLINQPQTERQLPRLRQTTEYWDEGKSS